MPNVLNQARRAPWRRKLRRATYAVVLLLVGVVAARFRPQIESLVSPGQKNATVTYVVDGDTVVLADGRHLRYLGIDAPEMDAASKRSRDLAERARSFNVSLVGGHEVRLEFDRVRKDKYGRTLAYVYVGGTSANAALVAEGLARASFFGDNRLHLDEYVRIEDEAKAKRLGMWADTAHGEAP